MSKRFLITLITLVVIGISATIAVFLAKGYTFSPQTGNFSGTGIISVTSEPDGASVYVDGHLTSATNATIPRLPPKPYQVKIVKEGFIPWEKQVEVKEGLVSEVKVSLFPAIPTIYPLTFNGVENPVLSWDGSKLAFSVPASTESGSVRQKGGVWVLTMVSSQPISFNRSSGFRQLIPATPDLDWTKAQIRFSPDSKSLLVTLQEGGREGVANQRTYLVPADSATSLGELRDLTPVVASTLQSWDEEQKTRDAERVAAILDPSAQKVASSSAVVKWAPDESKFMYSGKQGVVKVYDLTDNKQYQLPEAKDYQWLPDSRHIILVQDGKVSISEFDGGNVAVIFAGNFINGFVFPWPDSSRLVMLSSLPTPTASKPNLYGVNLR